MWCSNKKNETNEWKIYQIYFDQKKANGYITFLKKKSIYNKLICETEIDCTAGSLDIFYSGCIYVSNVTKRHRI